MKKRRLSVKQDWSLPRDVLLHCICPYLNIRDLSRFDRATMGDIDTNIMWKKIFLRDFPTTIEYFTGQEDWKELYRLHIRVHLRVARAIPASEKVLYDCKNDVLVMFNNDKRYIAFQHIMKDVPFRYITEEDGPEFKQLFDDGKIFLEIYTNGYGAIFLSGYKNYLITKRNELIPHDWGYFYGKDFIICPTSNRQSIVVRRVDDGTIVSQRHYTYIERLSKDRWMYDGKNRFGITSEGLLIDLPWCRCLCRIRRPFANPFHIDVSRRLYIHSARYDCVEMDLNDEPRSSYLRACYNDVMFYCVRDNNELTFIRLGEKIQHVTLLPDGPWEKIRLAPKGGVYLFSSKQILFMN